MSFTLSEFCPANPVLEINNQEVKLSLYTLRVSIILDKKYGDVSAIYALLKEPESSIEIINIIWELVLNKELFNNDREEFKTKFLNSDLVKIAKDAMKALDECIVLAMPRVINKARAKVLDDIAKSQTEEKTCYAKYFDSLAKRYGMTIDSFLDLTMRQISAMLKTIGDASYDELEVQAALQGKKLKPRMKAIEISEEEDDAQDAEAQEMMKRLKEEYDKNQGKD